MERGGQAVNLTFNYELTTRILKKRGQAVSNPNVCWGDFIIKKVQKWANENSYYRRKGGGSVERWNEKRKFF